MIRHLLFAVFALLNVLSATALFAQRTVLTMHGVAWDSLRMTPLEGALVAMEGTNRSAISNARGQFQFDSVAPGTYTLLLQHESMDSLGMPGVSAKVVFASERDSVLLSVPSFRIFWRRACGARATPADSGFIFGTISNARTSAALPNALVSVSWLDLAFSKANGVSQQRMGGVVRTDSSGAYIVCGIPNDIGILVSATGDSASVGYANVLMDKARVRRVDLVVGTVVITGTAPHGVIAGTLRNTTGQPVPEARVIVEGAPEVRSDRNGNFLLRDVPIGTRQLDVVAIGSLPISTSVNVLERDTARVNLEMHKVTALDAVAVKAASIREKRKLDFEEHRKLGIGKFLDSTVIEKRQSLMAAMAETPYLRLDKNGKIYFGSGNSRCYPTFWLDKRVVDQEEVRLVDAKMIAAMEIYSKGFMIPTEFWTVRGAPGCTVVVWTKLYFSP